MILKLDSFTERDMFEVLLELIGRDMRRTEQDGVDKVQMETETKAFAVSGSLQNSSILIISLSGSR